MQKSQRFRQSMNIYIKLVGVHWAGFPYPWPTYACSPSYSMICLVVGDSHSSPMSCLFWSLWEAHGFLCADAPVATTFVRWVSSTSWKISLDYTSLFHVLSAKEHFFFCLCLYPTPSSPPLRLDPSCPLQQSLKHFWYKAAKQLWQRTHLPCAICQKSFQNISVTLGPGSASEFCHVWPERQSAGKFISLTILIFICKYR